MRKLSKKELSSAVFFALSLTFTILLYEFGSPLWVTIVGAISTTSLFMIFSRFVIKDSSLVGNNLGRIHKFLNSAYISVTGLMMILTIAQIVSYSLDPWIPLTLGGMVLSKGVGFIYTS